MAVFEGTGRQIYATLCSNLLSCAYGTSVGWASSSLPFLQSNETVLPSGPLSKEGLVKFIICRGNCECFDVIEINYSCPHHRFILDSVHLHNRRALG